MTSMDGEPVSESWVYWAAARTVDQHQARPGESWAPGACQQCTASGCAQLNWAQQTVATIREGQRWTPR